MVKCILIEFLDKGVSVSTLDDIAFGKEDELLKGMTETILAAANGNIKFMIHIALFNYSLTLRKHWKHQQKASGIDF